MKRILCTLLAILLIVGPYAGLTTCAATNFPTEPDDIAGGVSSSDVSISSMKDFLLEHDYPESYLASLIPQQLKDLYALCSENNAYFLSTETAPGSPEGISPEQLSFRITTSFNTIGGCYYKIFVTIDYDWIKLPAIRGVDAIAVNWDSDVLVYDGSFKSVDYAHSAVSNSWLTYKTWTAPSRLAQSALGIYTYINLQEKIPASGNEYLYADGLKGTVTFTLKPKYDLTMGVIPGDAAVAVSCEYTHNKNIFVSFALSYTEEMLTGGPGFLRDSMIAGENIGYTIKAL